MAKQAAIQQDGTITEALSNAMFRVARRQSEVRNESLRSFEGENYL
jgi:translation initiation factor IF-1